MSTADETTKPTDSATPTTPPAETITTTTTESSLLDGDGDGDGAAATEEKSLLDGDDDASPTAAPAEEPPQFGLEAVELDALKTAAGEGVTFNDEQLTGFLSILNSAGSRAEMAEQLISYYLKHEEVVANQIGQDWNNMIAEWKTAVDTDPLIGGVNKQQSLAQAREVVETYADDAAELKGLLRSTGLGNHPQFIKLLVNVRKNTPGEATPVKGDKSGAPLSFAERLYPKT